MRRIIRYALIIFFISSCDNKRETDYDSNPTESDSLLNLTKDLIQTTIPEKSGLDLFFAYMNQNNFRTDTNRLKQVWAWKNASDSPKELVGGRIIIKMPYPVEQDKTFFTDSKNYFFAKWDSIKSTFNNGSDFLLMTWVINQDGLRIENEIFRRLSKHLLNFPTYCFRDGNRVYALTNRFSIEEKITEKYAKILRDYVNNKSIMYGHYAMDTIR